MTQCIMITFQPLFRYFVSLFVELITLPLRAKQAAVSLRGNMWDFLWGSDFGCLPSSGWPLSHCWWQATTRLGTPALLQPGLCRWWHYVGVVLAFLSFFLNYVLSVDVCLSLLFMADERPFFSPVKVIFLISNVSSGFGPCSDRLGR